MIDTRIYKWVYEATYSETNALKYERKIQKALYEAPSIWESLLKPERTILYGFKTREYARMCKKCIESLELDLIKSRIRKI